MHALLLVIIAIIDSISLLFAYLGNWSGDYLTSRAIALECTCWRAIVSKTSSLPVHMHAEGPNEFVRLSLQEICCLTSSAEYVEQ